MPSPKEQKPVPSTSSSPSASTKGKIPVVVIDSDSETPNKPKARISRKKKPFSSRPFLENKPVVENSRKEGFVSKEDKKKPKGGYEVGTKKAIAVSDNRTVSIYIGPVGGLVSEYEFLGKSLQSLQFCYPANLSFVAIADSVSVHFPDITAPLGKIDHFIQHGILAESDNWVNFLDENPNFNKTTIQPYLATGTDNGRYTKLQRTFLQKDITPALLLSHFPHKKTFLCIVGLEHCQQEERIVQKKGIKAEKEDKLPITVRQKRSHSLMKVIYFITSGWIGILLI